MSMVNRFIRDVLDAAAAYVAAVQTLRSMETDDEIGMEEYEAAGRRMDEVYTRLAEAVVTLAESERVWNDSHRGGTP